MPATPPPSYSLRKRKHVSYRVPSRSASPGEDPDIHPGSMYGLRYLYRYRDLQRKHALQRVEPLENPLEGRIPMRRRSTRYASSIRQTSFSFPESEPE